MKQFILLLAIGSSLLSCTASTDKQTSESMAIAKRYMEAVENNNAAAMDSLLADNYMGYGPSVGDSINKAGALESWKYNAEHLYESIKYTRHQDIAVTVNDGDEVNRGNWVSNWALLTIKYKDGRGPVNVYVNVIYKIENGKIARSRTFYNEADVLRQLGYTIQPPGLGQ